MVIYSVTFSVEEPLREDWLGWMERTLIPQIMGTQLFHTHHVQELLEPAPQPGLLTFNAQFHCRDLDSLDKYRKIHADEIEQSLSDRYRERVLAFRTVLRRL